MPAAGFELEQPLPKTSAAATQIAVALSERR
jgi:hypothetical protein